MVNQLMEPTKHVHICDLSCPVEHVMRGAPVVDPEYTLRMTAQAMVIVKARVAIVCAPHKSTTIVTERDIARAVSDGADPGRTRVAELAWAHLAALVPTVTISDAVQHMSEEGTQYISVRFDGNVVGLVTAEDLVEVLNGKLPSLTNA